MRSLMKHKSAITKRRLIIIFILCTIMTVSVVTGFSSGFISDTTVYTPDGARIVTYADAPKSGTPEDYDALSSLRFTAQNLYKAEFFRGDTQGSCSADIGMGLKYDQNVVNTRVIHGNVMYQEAVSLSAAKKTANQRYIEDSHILYRPSTGVKNNLPVYSDQVVPWTIDEYYQNYGAFPNELSKYVITPKTILSIRDNNAPEAVAVDVKNSDGATDGETGAEDENDPNAGELSCDNPQELVRGDDGYYTFTLTLDPTGSSKYYRNEVKSLGGALSHPVFLFVELVVKIDENFYPVSITTTESYDIEIKMLGALTCTGTFTETFSSINQVGEVPEQEFFRSKFTATGDEPITVAKDASDYLMEVFDPYLNGESTLDLSANVFIDDISLKNVKLSANLKTMNVRVAYGNTYIEYADDKVYVTLNDIKGYISVDKVTELMKDERIASLIGGGMPDINGLLGPDTLSTILDGCTVSVTDGTACVHLPFTLGEGASALTVDAKLYIDEQKMTLIRIEGDVKIGDMRISLNAKPLDRVSFPAVGPNYKSLDGIFDLVPEILDFMSADALTVSGSVSANAVTGKDKKPVELNVGIDGIINIKDENGVTAEFTADCFGVKPTVKYAAGVVYVELGNVKLSAQMSELDALMTAVKEITGFEIPASILEFIDAIKPATIANWLNILQSLDVSENGLELGLKLATVPGSISIEKAENAYNIKANVGAAAGGISVALGADLSVATADMREVTLDGEYVNVNDLLPVLQTAYNIVNSGVLSADIIVTAGEQQLAANLQLDFTDKANVKIKLTEPTLPLSVTVIGKTAYIEIDGEKYGAKLAGNLDNVKTLVALLDKYIPENVKPTLEKLLSGDLGEINIANIVNSVLDAIKSVSLDGDVLVAEIAYKDISARLEATTDFSTLNVVTTLNENQIKISFENLAPTATVAEPETTDDFIQASSLITIVKSVVPLLDAKGLALGVSAEFGDIRISGDVVADFGSGESGFAIHAALLVGDVPVNVYFKDNTVYMTLAETVSVKVGATEPELDAMLAELQAAMPDVDLSQVETAVELMFDLAMLKDAEIRAVRTDNEKFAVELNLADVGLDASFTLGFDTANDKFGAITANVNAMGKALDAKVSVTLDAAGAISSLGIDMLGNDAEGNQTSARLADVMLTDTAAQTVTVPQRDYINAIEFIDYIKPVRTLVEQAKTAKTLELDLSAYTLDDNNSQFDIAGSLKISLEQPLRLQGEITLFSSAENAEKIYITLVDGVLYLKTGNIMLYFDTTKDGARLYDVISAYLPEYLNNEIKKLFGLAEGYLPEGISPVLDGVNRLLENKDSNNIISALFGGVYGENSDSVMLTLLNALRVKTNGGKHTVSASMLGVTLNITPNIVNERLDSVSAGMNIGPLFLGLTAGVGFSDDSLGVTAPVNANAYVSVMDFVDAINNAVNTVTTTDKDGNIAFEVSSFTFDYDIFAIEYETKKDDNGNVVKDADGNPVYALDKDGNKIPVKDDAGRDTPLRDEKGNKVVDTHIRINEKSGNSALKVKLVKKEKTDADGNVVNDENNEPIYEYKFNLEAHVVLDISSLKNSTPLELDLYVINNDDYPDGIVFIDYYEQKNGHGERIKLDYTSVMQILAAAMDIMGVNDETVEMLLGDYRLNIDKTVFESMDIAGIDELRQMLNGLADAVNSAKAAFADIKSAWNLVYNAGDVSGLIDSREQITELLESGIEKLKAVIGMFSSGDEEKELNKKDRSGKSGAELYNMIVNAVSFGSGAVLDADKNPVEGKTQLQAVIDNEIATQTEGTSYVTVAQTKQGDKTVLDRVSVDGLDVNTNLLRTFDMEFKAGTDMTVTLPDGYDTTQGNRTYSDFGNIKHLLFDVMNTANLLEFDIGGKDTSDEINMHLKLGADWLANIDISVKYNAKVKIIPVGMDENGKTQYKTAAAIEIYNKKSQLEILGIGSKVIIPECTTRLYFYDNVLYLQGIRSWQLNKERHVGTITGVKCVADVWGSKKDRYPNIRSTEYLSNVDCDFDYVNVMYTVDELANVISKDMSKFLNEFVFYLIPITTEKIAGQDIRQIINDQIGGSSSSGATENPTKTLAQIFKGYTYANGKHSLTIGLKELAGSDSLSDVNLSITGANDGDDNILDNYISSLHLDTSIAGIITVNLDATLRNVAVANNEIYSKGLAPTDVTRQNGKFQANGKTYMLECANYDRNTLYTLDGTIYSADGWLYVDNGVISPVMRPADGSDAFTWTSTRYDSRYCDDAYKFGDTGATYYYYTSLEGLAYCNTGNYDTYYVGVNPDGSKYVYRIENDAQVRVTVKSITNDFLAQVTTDADGKIVSVTNRAGGVQWERPWQTVA